MLNDNELIGIIIVSIFILIIGVFKCIKSRTDYDNNDSTDYYSKIEDDNQHIIYNYIHNSENIDLTNEKQFQFDHRNSV